MKILTVIGARPQFVKAAALSRDFQSRPGIDEVIVHTGQHFDYGMSDVFFEEMEIPRPKHQLGIHSVGHGAMTGRMLEGIANKNFKPPITLPRQVSAWALVRHWSGKRRLESRRGRPLKAT